MRGWLGRIAGLAIGLLAMPANAQVPAPPVRQSVDGNGVDLVGGKFVASVTDLTIGTAARGLAFTRSWTGAGWRHAYVATISGNGSAVNGSQVVVSVGSRSDDFQYQSGSYVGSQGGGAKLTKSSGVYTYTSGDGAVVTFSEATSIYERYTSNLGRAVKLATPDGNTITYHYKSQAFQQCDFGPSSCYARTIVRLQSVTSAYGYQLRFNYAEDVYSPGETNPEAWQNMIGVTAINQAVEYCSPTAATCSLSNTWPSVQFGGAFPYGLTSVADAMGRQTSYSYDTQDRLTSIRRPGASSNDVTIAYSAGKVSSVTKFGQTWTYTFSDASSVRTTTVRDPLLHDSFVYSDTNSFRIGASVNENGQSTGYEYEPTSQARLRKVTAPGGNATEYVYDGRGNVTSTIAHPKGEALHAVGTPSALDLTAYATYPSACTEASTCNQPTTTTDATGATTNYYYLSHGGLNYVEAPASVTGGIRQRITYSYSSPLNAWLQGPSGLTMSPDAVILPTGTSTCRTANTCPGSANETKTSYGYPAAGLGVGTTNFQVLSVTVAAGDNSISSTTAYTYDNVRNVVATTDPMGQVWKTSYNAARQVETVTSPDPDALPGGNGVLRNRQVVTHYRGDGLADSVTQATVDANGGGYQALQYAFPEYDAYGRKVLERVHDARSTTSFPYNEAYALTQYSYDVVGRLECTAVRMTKTAYASLPSACTQSAGGVDRITKTIYEYAGLPGIVQTGVGTGLARDEVSYVHNQNGQTTRVADAKGNFTSYVYDGHDRLERTCYNRDVSACNGAAPDNVKLTYGTSGTATGRVVLRSLRGHGDATGIAYSYDALGRVTVTDFPGPGPTDQDINYTYDLFGDLRMAEDQATPKHQAWFDYDALGRVIRAGDAIGHRGYGYDAAGRRTAMAWTNGGPTILYAYDNTGAVMKISENGGPELATFLYDDLGRRTRLTRGNGVMSHYGYDGASRLASLGLDLTGTVNDQSIGFAYNQAGQITQRSASNDAYAWTQHYNVNRSYQANGLNQYCVIGATSCTATGPGIITPVYDTKGNLTSAGGPTVWGYNTKNQLTQVSGTNKVFYYDPLGRLDGIMQSASVGETGFQYDGDHISTEVSAASGFPVVRRYVWGPGADEPLVWYEGSGTADRRYLVADERGSVVAVTDGGGNPLAINSYDEYGIPASTNLGRFQYTGQAWIPELGMYHYKARTYSPTLGRFMQTDPIGYGDGVNWYNYVGGDPVNGSDPSGLDAITKLCDGRPCLSQDGGGSSGFDFTTDILVIGKPNYVVPSQVVLPKIAYTFAPETFRLLESPVVFTSPKTNKKNPKPVKPCQASRPSTLSKIADSAGNFSDAAAYLSLGSLGLAAVTSETIVGGIGFAGLSAGLGAFSLLGSGIQATAQYFDGNTRGMVATVAGAGVSHLSTPAASRALEATTGFEKVVVSVGGDAYGRMTNLIVCSGKK